MLCLSEQLFWGKVSSNQHPWGLKAGWWSAQRSESKSHRGSGDLDWWTVALWAPFKTGRSELIHYHWVEMNQLWFTVAEWSYWSLSWRWVTNTICLDHCHNTSQDNCWFACLQLGMQELQDDLHCSLMVGHMVSHAPGASPQWYK